MDEEELVHYVICNSYDLVVTFNELKGKTFSSVKKDKSNEYIIFSNDEEWDDDVYVMLHDQDCCEGVTIDDICGDLKDLENAEILYTYEDFDQSSIDNIEQNGYHYSDESFTYTFYTLRTVKGTVTIRWYGQSNGYYSESADLYKVNLELLK